MLGVVPRPASPQGGTVKFKVGDRVRHREYDNKVGEVFGVHPGTIWVLWKGAGVPSNTIPSNLIPVPIMEGDRVKAIKDCGLSFLGNVLAVDGEYAWVKMSNGNYLSVQQKLLELA